MRYHMATDKPLRNFDDDLDDVSIWNEQLEFLRKMVSSCYSSWNIACAWLNIVVVEVYGVHLHRFSCWSINFKRTHEYLNMPENLHICGQPDCCSASVRRQKSDYWRFVRVVGLLKTYVHYSYFIAYLQFMHLNSLTSGVQKCVPVLGLLLHYFFKSRTLYPWWGVISAAAKNGLATNGVETNSAYQKVGVDAVCCLASSHLTVKH